MVFRVFFNQKIVEDVKARIEKSSNPTPPGTSDEEPKTATPPVTTSGTPDETTKKNLFPPMALKRARRNIKRRKTKVESEATPPNPNSNTNSNMDEPSRKRSLSTVSTVFKSYFVANTLENIS